MQIDELEPRKVFHYFAELSKIPHGSGNTDRLAEYCLSFARERGLKAQKDGYGNVIILKRGSAGYENSEPVILQGHLDMVCEKLAGCSRDMDREGPELKVSGDWLMADGTTLGGDNGIAVAYILALLDSDLPHPPIEAVLTADEEIGLRGARELDTSMLKGKRMINMDSEEEGILTVSCAGGIRVECAVPLTMEGTDGLCAVELSIGGLAGGHSGMDIDKCRKNAVKVLGELLARLCGLTELRLAALSSGGRLNVIPCAAKATVCLKADETDILKSAVSDFDSLMKNDCMAVEPDVFAAVKSVTVPEFCADRESTERAVFAMLNVFDGVYAMNPSVSGLVQTSSNLGAAELSDRDLRLGFMVRSNTAYGKDALLLRMRSLLECPYIRGRIELGDDYPAWEYRHISPLRDVMESVYTDMYGAPPKINVIHAGLECGILSEKLPGTDMVSIGPDLQNVHSPAERLSISSARRCWEYLLKVLESLRD